MYAKFQEDAEKFLVDKGQGSYKSKESLRLLKPLLQSMNDSGFADERLRLAVHIVGLLFQLLSPKDLVAFFLEDYKNNNSIVEARLHLKEIRAYAVKECQDAMAQIHETIATYAENHNDKVPTHAQLRALKPLTNPKL